MQRALRAGIRECGDQGELRGWGTEIPSGFIPNEPGISGCSAWQREGALG